MAIEPTVPKTNKTAQALKIKDWLQILGGTAASLREMFYEVMAILSASDKMAITS
ncbi:hypothetical protein [Trueperella pyogenes]|uniref:hypothetical protein n=1 Tax=Trueperella pyogenes TaxID=1661 RepID=UPI0013E987A3|nr:hypothetical protein [Trueperella pyogenes]